MSVSSAHHTYIVFVWLPKQCSELNATDQLWKELKGDLAVNSQTGITNH
jgi:hypothetical protein